MVGELAVLGQRTEAGLRPAEVALSEVVLCRTHHRRGGDEVAVAGRGLHHELRPEELTDQRLEDDVRGEHHLAPVVVDGRERLGHLADALPGGVVVPGVEVSGSVEALDLLAQSQVVQREVLGEPDLVHAVHRDGGVVHVRGRGPVARGEHVQAEDVLDVHPRTDVALDELHPVGGVHWSNAFDIRAFSMFWFTWRTTFAL